MNKKEKILIFVLLINLFPVILPAETYKYLWSKKKKNASCIFNRIPPPKDYKRIKINPAEA